MPSEKNHSLSRRNLTDSTGLECDRTCWLSTEGRLVIIENKRDDSGKDIVWQALRYVAYCSALKKSKIVEMFGNHHGKPEEEASEIIRDFIDVEESEI